MSTGILTRTSRTILLKIPVEMCRITRIQMTRWKVSFMLQTFFSVKLWWTFWNVNFSLNFWNVNFFLQFSKHEFFFEFLKRELFFKFLKYEFFFEFLERKFLFEILKHEFLFEFQKRKFLFEFVKRVTPRIDLSRAYTEELEMPPSSCIRFVYAWDSRSRQLFNGNQSKASWE